MKTHAAREDMKQRHHAKNRLAVGNRRHHRLPLAQIDGELAVGDVDAFREAGGSAGVLKRRQFVRLGRRIGEGGGFIVPPLGQRPAALAADAEPGGDPEPAGQPFHQRAHLVIEDYGDRIGIGQNVMKFPFGVDGVDRHRLHPRGVDGEHGDRHGHRISADQRHPVARAADFQEFGGEPADAADILAVGQRPLLGYQGRGVAGAFGRVRQHVNDGGVNGRQAGHGTLFSVRGRRNQCLWGFDRPRQIQGNLSRTVLHRANPQGGQAWRPI